MVSWEKIFLSQKSICRAVSLWVIHKCILSSGEDTVSMRNCLSPSESSESIFCAREVYLWILIFFGGFFRISSDIMYGHEMQESTHFLACWQMISAVCRARKIGLLDICRARWPNNSHFSHELFSPFSVSTSPSAHGGPFGVSLTVSPCRVRKNIFRIPASWRRERRSLLISRKVCLRTSSPGRAYRAVS